MMTRNQATERKSTMAIKEVHSRWSEKLTRTI